MKFELEIKSLDMHGDTVTVAADGQAASDWQWSPVKQWRLDMPLAARKFLTLGRRLTVDVTPK